MTTFTINLNEIPLEYGYANGFTFDESKFESEEAMQRTLTAFFIHGLKRKVNDTVNGRAAKEEDKSDEAKATYFAEFVERAYAGQLDSRSGKIEITDSLVDEKLALNGMSRGQLVEVGGRNIAAEVIIEQALIQTGKYRKAKEVKVDLDIKL